MSRYRIAAIPGDGIGREVMPEGIKALRRVADLCGFHLDLEAFDWSCDTYLRTGCMMPSDGLDRLAEFDAIYLGAVGYPTVPDHISLWEMLIPIRRGFDQYVNLRPCRVFPGLRSPLADASERDIDFWIVRENVEGEYSAIGGRLFEGTDREMACQEAIFTRKGVDRAIEFAFGFAEREGLGRVTSATKSNGLSISMPFWDERFQKIASRFPGITSDQFHIDALCAHFVLRPEHFKVVVASNLFGDILSDLGPALCGSIGIAPSANLNPEKTAPSMFEPVHGSAPDIAGRSLANPIGQIWAGAMMLGFLGEAEAELRIMSAIEKVVAQGHALTPDLGGTGRTSDLGDAIAEAIIACRHDRSSIQSMET